MVSKKTHRKKKRINKWNHEFVVQGHYGKGGWTDLTHNDTRKEALADFHDYQRNEMRPHRIIERRVLNPKYRPPRRRSHG